MFVLAAIPRIIALEMLFLAVVFLPLYIDTNHNDVGGDPHFMQWPKCPQRIRV
jgi:hypothetical protein